jgi:hypothetical protein
MPARCFPALQLNQLYRNAAADHRCRSLQAAERNIVLRITQSVDLGAARLEQHRHFVLGYFLLLHCLGELKRDNLLNCLRLYLFKNTFLLKEVIDAGAPPKRMTIRGPKRPCGFPWPECR